MDHNYTVTIIICILSMLSLAIDVGKNTILNTDDIKWFRLTFIICAAGVLCEYFGVLFDRTGCAPQKIHWFITYIEFSISPFLAVFLSRSCGMKRTIKPMIIVMALNVIAQTVSLFNGMIFYIDSSSAFYRGSCYWLYILFCGISFFYILVVFALIGIKTKLRNFLCLLLIASITLIGQVANILDGSINSGYLSICVTAVLLYIFIQNMLRHTMIEKITVEQEISNHDALTKVMSRFSYDNRVHEFDSLIAQNPLELKFAVCECDLNNLKLVNDSFGHDKGDEYIIKCCRTICNFFKHSPVFRIGGDEFVVIVQNDDFDNFEQIKNTIGDFSVSEIKKDIPLIEKKSFSAGFAVYNPDSDKTFGDVLKRADVEMYKHKKLLKKM
ncbi:MAG: GGDEF domain-containing protein [Treponema sp.]|uniref:GGDEF domain-containing protein n=1 Tax=Treponema sp. TaxID=166 RepID=UPI00298E189C|nr:GGDEF domain-containing protein [Treponema sp.]MBR5933913.1 GGDEF domain-containing protein [Treponema sp.]